MGPFSGGIQSTRHQRRNSRAAAGVEIPRLRTVPFDFSKSLLFLRKQSNGHLTLKNGFPFTLAAHLVGEVTL